MPTAPPPPARRPASRARAARRAAAALVAAVCAGRPALARAQPLQFRHLGVADGLASSFVSDIARDRRGVMWIGTAHGVSRYDGHRFRTYAHDRADPGSLPAGVVAQVYEDRAGGLWVATPAGVSRYDRARDAFVTYMADTAAGANLAVRVGGGEAAPRSITSVVEDGRGTFWVGTSAGLYQLDRRTGVATRHALAPDRAAPHVTTLYVDRRARLWVGTRGGLDVLDARGTPTAHYGHRADDARGLPDSVVRSLAEDPAGGLWVGTGDGGLARLDERGGRFERFRHDPADPGSIAKDRIVRLLPDRSGAGLWVGTENGGLDFLTYRSRRITHHRFDPSAPSGVGSNSIWALHQGGDGALWVGTYSGGVDVSLPAGGAIRHYAPVPGDSTSLGYTAVPAFTEDRRGHVWVATDGGGLNEFDPAAGRFTHYTPQNSSLNSEAAVGVHVDRGGTLWVATWQGGISRFEPGAAGRRPRFVPYTTRTSDIPNDNVYEILEDRRGGLWVGTENGVVAQLDRARGRFPRQLAVKAPELPLSAVVQLRELRDGTFAVGLRDGGVTILDPATGAQTHYVAGRGLANNGVHALLEGGEPGVLWVGTDEGLDRLDRRTGRATHYGEGDGLPSAVVEGLVSDAAGRVWVSTDRGLARFDPAGLPAHAPAFRAFGRADGVQGGEFLMRSAFRGRDGALYFGGNQGFTVVRPELIAEAAPGPAVAITGLQLFNRPVAVGAPGSPLARAAGETDTLALAHAQNVVTFEFAAPDYAVPGATRYAYRLAGFDAEWQDVGAQHAASYTNLSPGGYAFRVRARVGDGPWGPEAALAVAVRPPWWGTWWFRLLAAGGAAAGALQLLRFRERRRVEVALSRQALRDPLTGLANRALFRDRVEHALARLARAGGAAPGEPARVAALFLDLDGFKGVNDTLGHAAGDALLQAVAARLLNATRGCDTVARLGGDEFAVLLENARGAPDAHAVAARITEALRAPVAVGEGRGRDAEARAPGARLTDARLTDARVTEARVGVSVGIAFAEPGVDADALLRNADAAMYQAKANGKGRHAVFDPALVAAAADRQELERDLARALARGELSLAYQPVVALASGAIVKAEALLRWRHPSRGPVSPATFIPLAEASGLIVALGRWVLDEACREAAGWPAGAGGAPRRVTVNVSGRQLLDPALPGHVAGALAASGLGASRLTLEITESVLMHDTDAAIAMLHTLKALGVRLAVDDFGTGYSSLSYLQKFPVDVLKIDKSFVDGVARGGHDAALARTIVALGDMLGLRTVAEGVETAEQAEALRAMGCRYGQGYLFARPVGAEEVRALLAGERKGVVG